MSERRAPAREGALEALALRYERDRDPAPRVVARGRAEVARNILQLADEHDIPVERDPDLLQCLAPLRTGADVPPHAWEAVARILAFLYAANRDA